MAKHDKPIPQENPHLCCRRTRTSSLTDMAVGVTHDFNNLLASIAGNNRIVLEHEGIDPALRENLEQTQESAEQAMELTSKLLMFTGRHPVDLDAVDLSRLVRDMLEEVENELPEHIQLEAHTGTAVPVIEGDPHHIRTAVKNLITNAAEAIVDTDGAISLTTGVADCDRDCLERGFTQDPGQEGRYAYVDVADTGCGIPEQIRDRLTDPFFSTKIRGQGLGLAVVFGVVREHHGNLQVTSAPGEGTTVRMLFPCPSET